MMPQENQRNKWDVIMELFYKEDRIVGIQTPEDIEKAFVKYAALVNKVGAASSEKLQKLAGE